MECPVCTTDLVMTERQGVEIDHCPKCRGVWLDRGELDKIIERSNAYMSGAGGAAGSAARRRDDDDDDDYARRPSPNPPHPHGQRRRKSFWEEMFD